MYQRKIKKLISDKLFQGKAIIIVGARQVGKTTLSEQILNEYSGKDGIIRFNADNPKDRESLNNKNLEELNGIIGSNKFVFIDEAQKVETIGQTLKLLVDAHGKKIQIIATGSSSLNLLDKTSEPLTGRKFVFRLHALSMEEMYPDGNLLSLDKELPSRLIYGTYPGVVALNGQAEKEDLLDELCSSNLFKDIMEFQQVKNSSVLFSLLKALALQVGSEASYNELSNIIGIEKKTVERYIDLMEKNYIIFRLEPFSTNKRRTISKLRKIYFYDLGIRNAVINNFNPLDSRADTGALWENFMIIERLKYRNNRQKRANAYFLRTYDGAEIDLLEEAGGELKGYEFKFNGNLKKKAGCTAGIDYKILTPRDLEGFIF